MLRPSSFSGNVDHDKMTHTKHAPIGRASWQDPV